MRHLSPWIALTALLFASASFSAPYSFHPTSFEDYGVCPLECCRYREWTVNKTTALRAQRSDKAPVVFTAKKNDTVNGLTGVVITTEAGQAKLLKPLMLNGERVKKGELVHLLTPLGKNNYKIWYRGKRVRDFKDMNNLETLRPPVSVWWVKVKNDKGQIGWSNQPEHFDGKELCP
ncbi:MAG: hypothetical protein IPL51_02820 [Candidatus Competibacteraceae bacterium]|nr:hypothetical protein [Candidatus Competibacteraceae bacterium]